MRDSPEAAPQTITIPVVLPLNQHARVWMLLSGVLGIMLVAALVIVGYLWNVNGKWQDQVSSLTSTGYDLGDRIAEHQKQIDQLDSTNALLSDQIATAKDKVLTLSNEKAQWSDQTAYAQQQVDLLAGQIETSQTVIAQLGRCVEGEQQLAVYVAATAAPGEPVRQRPLQSQRFPPTRPPRSPSSVRASKACARPRLTRPPPSRSKSPNDAGPPGSARVFGRRCRGAARGLRHPARVDPSPVPTNFVPSASASAGRCRRPLPRRLHRRAAHERARAQHRVRLPRNGLRLRARRAHPRHQPARGGKRQAHRGLHLRRPRHSGNRRLHHHRCRHRDRDHRRVARHLLTPTAPKRTPSRATSSPSWATPTAAASPPRPAWCLARPRTALGGAVGTVLASTAQIEPVFGLRRLQLVRPGSWRRLRHERLRPELHRAHLDAQPAAR